MEFPRLYATATMLPLRSHRPPEPFGKVGYKMVNTPGVPYISPETVGHLSPDDFIYAVHPRERYEPSIVAMPPWFIDDENATIQIVCPLSTSSRGAQTFLCEVLQAPGDLWNKMGHKSDGLPRRVVARIFDPLHYRGHIDPVAEADREYAQEAAAYIQLHSKRDTKTYVDKPDLVPKFYGMWTTDITFDHLRKTGMTPITRNWVLRSEGRKRKKALDAAAAAKDADPSQQPKLVPYKFRPVRVILTQYVDGSPLWQHLIKSIDDMKNPVIKPREKFMQEEVRLEIFGNMLDTISRIEHLGVKLLTVPTRAPSVFLITEKTDTITKDKKDVAAETGKGKERAVVINKGTKSKYGVVLADFTQADVACYTDIGYDLVEKFPLPAHPLRSYDIVEYQSLRGWFPPEWMNNVEKYDKWGATHFKSSDYVVPETVDKIIKDVGWVKDLRKFGRATPYQRDPEWQEKLKALWADAPESWKKFTLPTAEEYRQRREASKETLRIAREKREEENFKQGKSVYQRVNRSIALDEYKKKFGHRPSSLDDPEWRQIVDKVYGDAREVTVWGKSYEISEKKPSKKKQAKQPGPLKPTIGGEVERLRLSLQATTLSDTSDRPYPEAESTPDTPRQSSFGRLPLADLTAIPPTFRAEQPHSPHTPRPHQTQRAHHDEMTSDENQTADEGQIFSDAPSGRKTSLSRHSEESEDPSRQSEESEDPKE